MRLKHSDIWRAIDRLAEREGLSASGLAKEAGLSPTVFNPSKRIFQKRKRWPSTESIAQILNATHTDLEDFVSLVGNKGETSKKPLPILTLAEAQQALHFSEDGLPTGRAWGKWKLPAYAEKGSFAIEITGTMALPLYEEGDIIILSLAAVCERGDRVLVRTQRGTLRLGELGRRNDRSIEIFPFDDVKPALILRPADIDFIYRIVFASQ